MSVGGNILQSNGVYSRVADCLKERELIKYLQVGFCSKQNQLNWNTRLSVTLVESNQKMEFSNLEKMCQDFSVAYLGKK